MKQVYHTVSVPVSIPVSETSITFVELPDLNAFVKNSRKQCLHITSPEIRGFNKQWPLRQRYRGNHGDGIKAFK